MTSPVSWSICARSDSLIEDSVQSPPRRRAVRGFVRSIAICGMLTGAAIAAPTPAPRRAVSVYLSQKFINAQLSAHARSAAIDELRLLLDPANGRIFLRGVVRVPTEDLRTVKLNSKFDAFRFQVAIRPETTRAGHLILEFPLDETYFYPKDAKDLKRERVSLPVQMMSLALASARGYLAALSGDYSGFDRRTRRLEDQIKKLDRALASEKDSGARDALAVERDDARLQLEGVPIERRRLKALAKELDGVLGFTGEKELDLNKDLGARENALILKLKFGRLVPYLDGVELSGLRVLRDERDGGGENFLAVDLDAALPSPLVPPIVSTPAARPPMSAPPSLVIRLDQALLDSESFQAAEGRNLGSRIRGFGIRLKDDGMHISGDWRTNFLFSIPFDTVIDLVSSGPNAFDLKVRDLHVAGIEIEALSGLVLAELQRRLDGALKGVCSFRYVGQEADHSRVLRAILEPKALIPAFPDLHLITVDVRDRELLLKLGRGDNPNHG